MAPVPLLADLNLWLNYSRNCMSTGDAESQDSIASVLNKEEKIVVEFYNKGCDLDDSMYTHSQAY